ncbi:MAG TPA: glycosyltransferase [Planctomycetia bacterium]|nr:glycosyltransferase [Planctomycetia bacterium]
MALPEFSLVLPVYNEAENIVPQLRAIAADVVGDYEILIVYDFDEDTTVPAVKGMNPKLPNVRLVKNTLGRGVVNAIRMGLTESRGWAGAVVMMADLSDPPARAPALVAKLREGCDVVAGSRYMKGGKQFGGPFLKRTLSWLAGSSAYWLTGVGIHDVTTNFRAYSRRLIAEVPIESRGGFELGLELTVKCHLRGWRVGEVPSEWRDRSAGESRFRLWKWLPGYLKWYLKLLFADPFGLSPRLARLRRQLPKPGDYKYFAVTDRPGYGWTVNRRTLACVIAPYDAAGNLVMVKVNRPAYEKGEAFWELPGGAGEPGEDPASAAKRELREETGYDCQGEAKVVGPTFEAVPGMGCTPHAIITLTNCVAGSTPSAAHLAAEGIVDFRAFTASEVSELAKSGKIRALPTLAALAYLGAGGLSDAPAGV